MHPTQPYSVSPSETLVNPHSNSFDPVTKIPENDPILKLSAIRRNVLLLVFCLAQFLDSFNNSALFSAIPTLVTDLGMASAELVWIMSAFQLTFASFLLIVSSKLGSLYIPVHELISKPLLDCRVGESAMYTVQVSLLEQVPSICIYRQTTT